MPHTELSQSLVLSVLSTVPDCEGLVKGRAYFLCFCCMLSLSLQNIVSKNAMQYRGNAQHDAQEFLLWLLDRVHEDLNNVVNYSGMPPLKVRDFAGSQHGRVAVTLHAVFLLN